MYVHVFDFFYLGASVSPDMVFRLQINQSDPTDYGTEAVVESNGTLCLYDAVSNGSANEVLDQIAVCQESREVG